VPRDGLAFEADFHSERTSVGEPGRLCFNTASQTKGEKRTSRNNRIDTPVHYSQVQTEKTCGTVNQNSSQSTST
jgi:hypothetical protein